MTRAPQKRTLETRSRLIRAAEDIIAEVGFDALRVEDVVQRAGTAKGTFFAHFKDKDTLMDLIIGARIAALLERMSAAAPPRTVDEITQALMPLCTFMGSERYVFDVILRYSGAASISDIGPIAETFGRQIEVFSGWFEGGPFRRDIPAELVSEGVQAFAFQAVAAHFCALHNDRALADRLHTYLQAWLMPTPAC